MKANDLMIGDWVSYIGNRETQQRKVLEITSLKQVQLWDGKYMPSWFLVGETHIEPISLTPEILEKNGFKKDFEERGFSEPYCVYINDDYQYIIKIYPKGLMDRYSRFEIGEYDDNEHVSLLINYVHELQHALRICGITKEIEL